MNKQTEQERINESNRKWFADTKEKDLKIINENFDYAEDMDSGMIICKQCSKNFSWTTWGGARSRAFTLAGKHIAKEHGVGKYNFTSPITLRSNFSDWADEKSDIIEKDLVENAPNYKIGDKVIDSDNEIGFITEILRRGDKKDYLLGKNDKVLLVMKVEGESTDCYVSVTQIKKLEIKN